MNRNQNPHHRHQKPEMIQKIEIVLIYFQEMNKINTPPKFKNSHLKHAEYGNDGSRNSPHEPHEDNLSRIKSIV